jgi:hypothetical protein
MSVKLEAPRKVTCYAVSSNTTKSVHKISLPVMSTFTEDSLFYDENSSMYRTGHTKINEFSGAGNAQISLMIVAMLFICKCVPFGTKATIIYLGVAPGDNVNFLASYFPFLTFHVYDSIRMDKIVETENLKKFLVDLRSEEIIEKYKSMENCYLISNIRNSLYGTSGANNSAIIDGDMNLQLEWCRKIKPKFAMLRYRPKRKDEIDKSDKHPHFYEYPEGYFLKIPFLKKDRTLGAFLITNAYESRKRYYHEYMISLFQHHNLNVRKVNFYDNPYKNDLQVGFFGEDKVTEISRKLDIEVLIPLNYACGVDWDHRAMFHVFSMYCKYMGIPQEEVPEKILTPYITMRQEIKKSETEDIYGKVETQED